MSEVSNRIKREENSIDGTFCRDTILLICCVHIFSLSVDMFHSASRLNNKDGRGRTRTLWGKCGQNVPGFWALVVVSDALVWPHHHNHVHLSRAVVPSQVGSTIAAFPTTMHFEKNPEEIKLSRPHAFP